MLRRVARIGQALQPFSMRDCVLLALRTAIRILTRSRPERGREPVDRALAAIATCAKYVHPSLLAGEPSRSIDHPAKTSEIHPQYSYLIHNSLIFSCYDPLARLHAKTSARNLRGGAAAAGGALEVLGPLATRNQYVIFTEQWMEPTSIVIRFTGESSSWQFSRRDLVLHLL
jgi:hypothetical protein